MTAGHTVSAFGYTLGDTVRYKPGVGVYGYEGCLDAEGRLPGVVVGFSPTRVRVQLTLRMGLLGPSFLRTRAVDADSLVRA